MKDAVSVRQGMFEVLNDMGIIYLDENQEEDIDLRDYIYDSVLFIGFIVEVENKFNIELDDDILVYDNLQSLNGFLKLLEGYISNYEENK